MLVVVPLAVPLSGKPSYSPAVVAAGALAAGSLLLDAGPVAAGLAVPWLLVVALLALRAAFPFDVRRLADDAGAVLPFAYLAVGAGGLVVSRYGARPLDFDDTIVELTAVHRGGVRVRALAGDACSLAPADGEHHGVLNAAGFALCGVLGWHRDARGAPEGAPL